MDERKTAEIEKITHEYINNSKVRSVVMRFRGADENRYRVSPLKDKTITTVVALSYSDDFKLPKSVTPYDMAVVDAVYTLYEWGIKDFTAEQVAKVMSGGFTKNLSAQRIGAVTRSLQKLSMIKISIDCTKEFQERGYINEKEIAEYRSYMLNLGELKIKFANGKRVNGYILNELPPLYQYAKKTHQIIKFPIGLLADDDLRDTDEKIVIRRYLIQRIEQMKRNPALPRKIRYEYSKDGVRQGMFETLGYSSGEYSNWKKKRSKLHTYTVQSLDHFVRQGYINGYKTIKGVRGQIEGAEIFIGEPISVNSGYGQSQ